MKAGTTPEIKLLLASLIVIVTVAAAVPSAVTGLAPTVIVEVALEAVPEVNTTVVVAAPDAPTGVAIAKVLVSATVEAKVQVEIPVLALLAVQALGFVSPPPASVTLNVGTTLGTALLFASLKVIVTVEVEVPFAVTGPDAVMDELPAAAVPPLKTTVPPATTTGVAMAMVFTSAFVDFRVQVEIPVVALLALQAPSVLPVPEEVKVGTVLGTALLFASFKVIVIVEVELPSAVTGLVPVIVEFPALTLPPVKTTVPPVITTGEARARVLISDLVVIRVQVDTPVLAAVKEQVPKVLLLPVEVKVGTTAGEIPLLLLSLNVIVMVEMELPSAVTGPLPVMVEFPALALPPVKTTVPPERETGVTIESVLVSALSELKVQTETPLAFVDEQVW